MWSASILATKGANLVGWGPYVYLGRDLRALNGTSFALLSSDSLERSQEASFHPKDTYPDAI
jgi:hypothetical protein